MAASRDLLAKIQELVSSGSYRIRSHAVRHMIEEGFDETQLLEVLSGKLQLLEEYSEESRYLVVGRFHFSERATSPLHVVCDLSNEEVLTL